MNLIFQIMQMGVVSHSKGDKRLYYYHQIRRMHLDEVPGKVSLDAACEFLK